MNANASEWKPSLDAAPYVSSLETLPTPPFELAAASESGVIYPTSETGIPKSSSASQTPPASSSIPGDRAYYPSYLPSSKLPFPSPLPPTTASAGSTTLPDPKLTSEWHPSFTAPPYTAYSYPSPYGGGLEDGGADGMMPYATPLANPQMLGAYPPSYGNQWATSFAPDTMSQFSDDTLLRLSEWSLVKDEDFREEFKKVMASTVELVSQDNVEEGTSTSQSKDGKQRSASSLLREKKTVGKEEKKEKQDKTTDRSSNAAVSLSRSETTHASEVEGRVHGEVRTAPVTWVEVLSSVNQSKPLSAKPRQEEVETKTATSVKKKKGSKVTVKINATTVIGNAKDEKGAGSKSKAGAATAASTSKKKGDPLPVPSVHTKGGKPGSGSSGNGHSMSPQALFPSGLNGRSEPNNVPFRAVDEEDYRNQWELDRPSTLEENQSASHYYPSDWEEGSQDEDDRSGLPPLTRNGKHRWKKLTKGQQKKDLAQKNAFESFAKALLHTASPFTIPLRERAKTSLPHIKVDQRFGKLGQPQNSVAQFVVAPLVSNYRPRHFHDVTPGDLLEFHYDLSHVLQCLPSSYALQIQYGPTWKRFALPYAYVACQNYRSEVLSLCPQEVPNSGGEPMYEEDVLKDITGIIMAVEELEQLQHYSFSAAMRKRLHLAPLYDILDTFFRQLENYQIEIWHMNQVPSTFVLKTNRLDVERLRPIYLDRDPNLWDQLPNVTREELKDRCMVWQHARGGGLVPDGDTSPSSLAPNNRNSNSNSSPTGGKPVAGASTSSTLKGVGENRMWGLPTAAASVSKEDQAGRPSLSLLKKGGAARPVSSETTENMYGTSSNGRYRKMDRESGAKNTEEDQETISTWMLLAPVAVSVLCVALTLGVLLKKRRSGSVS